MASVKEVSMSGIRWRSVCSLSLALAFVTPLLAQQPEASTPKSKHIVLDVVVTQGSGSHVGGLTQNDFKVLDNKSAQAILSFAPHVSEATPVQVLLVLDAINAPFTAVSSERDQIERFLRSHGEHLAAPTSLAVVTDTGIYVQEKTTTDGKALSAALDDYTMRLRMLRRSSGFYGAEERANLSIKSLAELTAREGAKPGRKLILWVSPGWPLLSGPNVSLTSKQQRQIFSNVVQFTNEFRENRVTLYALNAWGATEPLIRSMYYEGFTKPLIKPYDSDIGNLSLQVFAFQSGGLVMNSNDLGGLLEHCLEDTTSYYEISYDPPPAEHADEYHAIEVQVDKPGLKARTLRGYYSQPEAVGQ